MRPLSKFGPHRISFAISIDVWSLDCVLEETTMLVLYFTVLLLHFSAPFQRSFPIPWTSDAAAICALLHGFISQLSHYIFSHDSHHGKLLIMSFFFFCGSLVISQNAPHEGLSLYGCSLVDLMPSLMKFQLTSFRELRSSISLSIGVFKTLMAYNLNLELIRDFLISNSLL